MTTRLKRLKYTKVALVDAGANPKALVTFYKRADPMAGSELDTEVAAVAIEGVYDRMTKAHMALHPTQSYETAYGVVMATADGVRLHKLHKHHLAKTHTVAEILTGLQTPARERASILKYFA